MALTKKQKRAYRAGFLLLMNDLGGTGYLKEMLRVEKRKYANALIDVAIVPDIISHLEEFLEKQEEGSDA